MTTGAEYACEAPRRGAPLPARPRGAPGPSLSYRSSRGYASPHDAHRIRFRVQTPVESTTFAALARHWQRAEALGYDSVWLDDHFYGVATPASDDSLECWTLMAALARETSRLRFGTLVMCNELPPPGAAGEDGGDARPHQRRPARVRPRRRLVRARVHAPTATTSRRSAPASQQLDEALQICRLMWTEERATLRTAATTGSSEAWCNPKPVQQPHPPIMIGGGGEKVLLRIVAQHADRWNFGGSVDEFRHKIAVLERHCAAVGRDPAAIEKSWFGNVIIEPDPGRARRAPRQARRPRPRRRLRARTPSSARRSRSSPACASTSRSA